MNDQPSSIPPTPPLPPISTPKTSGLAIASLVLGILGITCILPLLGAVLALVFGIIALNQISKSQGVIKGHGQAVTGVILGGIGLLVIPAILGIFAAMFLPALNAARQKAREAVCISHVKQIGIACEMYADDYSKSLPQDLNQLTKYLGNTKNNFFCPSAKDRIHYSYEFTGATNKWQDDPNIVILREIERNHRGRRVVLYDDGHVELQKE